MALINEARNELINSKFSSIYLAKVDLPMYFNILTLFNRYLFYRFKLKRGLHILDAFPDMPRIQYYEAQNIIVSLLKNFIALIY